MKRKRDNDEEEADEAECFVSMTLKQYERQQKRNKWHWWVFGMVGGGYEREELIEDIEDTERKSFCGAFNLNARFFGPFCIDDEEADARLRSKEWRTLLGEAILHHDYHIFRELLLRGVDPELPCAYEIVRVTSAGPVMQLYRPLTYALYCKQITMVCDLLERRVNLTHVPTDTVHALTVDHYKGGTCVHEFGRYVSWVDGMYALTWLRHRVLRATPLKDVIDHVTAMTDMMGYTEWTK